MELSWVPLHGFLKMLGPVIYETDEFERASEIRYPDLNQSRRDRNPYMAGFDGLSTE
jgi:hypothetical protein